MLVTKQLLVAADFLNMEKNTMEVNRNWQLFGNQHSSNCLFYASQKKESYRLRTT